MPQASPPQPPRNKTQKPAERRRVNRSCIECTRRKIRCDGGVPCRNCQWYSVENRCGYRQRNRRTNPTWRAVEELSEAVQARNEILTQLLPSIDFSNFPGLSRGTIERLLSSEQEVTSDSPPEQNARSVNHLPDVPATSEVISGSDHEWDESREEDYTSPVGDDVNGLAVQQKPGSYLGISGVSAALRLISHVCPTARQNFVELSRSFLRNQRDSAQPPFTHTHTNTHRRASVSAPSTTEQTAIDAYFEHLHDMSSMIDEEWFRGLFLAKVRTDDAWTALLNSVMALGSIAAGDDSSHAFYYSRAQQALGHNIFGSGNLEMLQALILLGGGYLHYINSPNTAYLVMGMAFRMAIAMALHRETARGIQLQDDHLEKSPTSILAPGRLPRAEIRRRTWWSLVYADTCAGLLLGRPTIARWDPATMDTAMPSDQPSKNDKSQELDPILDNLERTDWAGTALRLCAEFAKISCRIEYRMAQFSRIAAREALSFDTQIQAWERSCPHIFKFGNTCPKRIRYGRDVLHYRVLVARIVVSRPHLLRLVGDSAVASGFTSDDWRVISICQEAANCIINSASSNPGKSLISVWHCSWYLFQACMVPLLSMALVKARPLQQYFSEETVNAWRESLERAIRTFKEMEPYRRSTDKYGDVIEALYLGIMASDWEGNLASQPHQPRSADVAALPDNNSFIFEGDSLPPLDAIQYWFDSDLVFGDDEFIWQLFPDQNTASDF